MVIALIATAVIGLCFNAASRKIKRSMRRMTSNGKSRSYDDKQTTKLPFIPNLHKISDRTIYVLFLIFAAPDDAKLGVVRLDYDYPPIPGDVDHPDSFSYDVVYRTIPGLTFEMAQSGRYGISTGDVIYCIGDKVVGNIVAHAIMMLSTQIL